MKNLLVIAFIVCVYQTSQAQLSIGVKANYSVTTAPQTQTDLAKLVQPLEILNMEYLGSEDQFSYGLSLYDENDLLFLNTDILLSHVEHNYRIDNLIDDLRRSTSSQEFSHKRTNLSIPVAAGFKLHNLKIGAGPIFNYTLSSESNLDAGSYISTNEENINMGFQFLVGYIIQDRIHIDLKRDINFTDVGNNYNYSDIPVELNSSPHTFSLSLAIYL
jgi:hypothetical protein